MHTVPELETKIRRFERYERIGRLNLVIATARGDDDGVRIIRRGLQRVRRSIETWRGALELAGRPIEGSA